MGVPDTHHISNRVVDLIDTALGASSAVAVGQRFFEMLQPFGCRAVYARGFTSHGAAPPDEEVYSRLSPPGWESFYADRRFQDVNYLNREVRLRSVPFRWSAMRPQAKAERAFAQALVDNGFPDGLALPCHGAGGYVGVVSLAFSQLDQISPAERVAIETAGLVLHGRMRVLSQRPAAAPNTATLTMRERDCIAFVAEGKSDQEIADRLGVSRNTVATHISHVRQKLNARTRAQALALFMSEAMRSI